MPKIKEEIPNWEEEDEFEIPDKKVEKKAEKTSGNKGLKCEVTSISKGVIYMTYILNGETYGKSMRLEGKYKDVKVGDTLNIIL